MKMEAYTYITINPFNGRMYIGVHKSKEYDPKYKGSGKSLNKAFDKYGWENFLNYMIRAFETMNEAYDHEAYLIDRYDAVSNPKFYNMKAGGAGGWDYCHEVTASRKCVYDPSTGKFKRVEPDEVDQYLSNGWLPGIATGFSSKGKFVRIYVSNGEERHCIKDCDLPEWESRGYRQIKTDFSKGRIWVNNGVVSRRIYPDELEEFRSKGFVKGYLRNPKSKKRDRPKITVQEEPAEVPEPSPTLGRVWITNGSENRMVYPSELPIEGFWRGVTRRSKAKDN